MEYQEFFLEVEDFRVQGRCLHLLEDILMLSSCAVICGHRGGAEDFEDIENYGQQKKDFLRGFLKLPNGIPSHDTIDRVFHHLEPRSLSLALYRWSSELLDFLSSYQINVDGKVLRGTAKAGKRTSDLCLVSAWVQGLSLGQVRVDEKSNEKTAIPELLNDLDLENAVVSIDAVAYHSSMADQIVAVQEDYLLVLSRIAKRKNQKTLYEQVTSEVKRQEIGLEKDVWEDFGSGRIEKRVCYVLKGLQFIEALDDWTDVKAVVMIEAQREKNEKVTSETRYYLSSLDESAIAFNRLVRSHRPATRWAIENRLHW
ncbi:MAG: ISAs1 family transposase [Bacteroidota bacterium]